jgi:hypothetical protein
MNHRLTTTILYAATVAAAALGATLMSGRAHAEGPIEVLPPFTGTFSRAEVQDEAIRNRDQLSSFANEYRMQRNATPVLQSGYTREEARSDFIASRDQVRAMTGEDSGSSYLGTHHARMPMATTLASSSGRQ